MQVDGGDVARGRALQEKWVAMQRTNNSWAGKGKAKSGEGLGRRQPFVGLLHGLHGAKKPRGFQLEEAIPGRKACVGRARRQALGLRWACFSYGSLCWWPSWPTVVDEKRAKVWAYLNTNKIKFKTWLNTKKLKHNIIRFI